MINYYDILGLRAGAGSLEIKTAFRRLAKLYHPDKNPEGREHFNKILKAYEILSDPVLKSSYDYKLQYNQQYSQTTTTARNTGTKNWRFDEKELKRRQYYNDHIKKYAKETARFETESEEKKTYNEYKYILFATPVAVALFLLIMKLASPSGSKHVHHNIQSSTPQPVASAYVMHTGDSVYSRFFGPSIFVQQQAQSLTVKNLGNADAILCLFSPAAFLRACFVKQGDSLNIRHLPKGPLVVRYSSGMDFDPAKKINKLPLTGTFVKDPHFYAAINLFKLSSKHQLLVLHEPNDEFKKIDETEFFEKN